MTRPAASFSKYTPGVVGNVITSYSIHYTKLYEHVGLYAYRRDFLLKLAEIPRSDLERLESLEQLRVLSAGHSILVAVVDEPTASYVSVVELGLYEASVKLYAELTAKGILV